MNNEVPEALTISAAAELYGCSPANVRMAIRREAAAGYWDGVAFTLTIGQREVTFVDKVWADARWRSSAEDGYESRLAKLPASTFGLDGTAWTLRGVKTDVKRSVDARGGRFAYYSQRVMQDTTEDN